MIVFFLDELLLQLLLLLLLLLSLIFVLLYYTHSTFPTSSQPNFYCMVHLYFDSSLYQYLCLN